MQLKPPFLALFLLFFFGVTQATVRTIPLSELRPGVKHQHTIELVYDILSIYHYKKLKLDDYLSAQILQRYLDDLDPGRFYFTTGDIDAFAHYRDKLDDMIKNADLTAVFSIFKLYRERVIERARYAVNLLTRDFDFDKDENYLFDRKDSAWATNTAALNDLWRRRVKNDILSLRLAKKEEAKIKKMLAQRYTYLDTSIRQFNADDVFQSFLNAYTHSIDPHTAYLSPRTYENFDISMRLSLEGIGAVLRSNNDYTQVVRIISGGPADLSGQLKEEDRIIGIGQGEEKEINDVIGWRLDDVVDQIRGPKNTSLRLEILTKESSYEGPSKIITLVRNEIKLEEQAATSSIIEVGRNKIGVINIPIFYIDFSAQARGEKNYRSTSRDVRTLIRGLRQKGIDGLIVDLRGNGGGSLFEALELTGLFIDRGPVVQTRDASGRITINNDPAPGVDYSGPLAVLVDRYSASASEIFAGAIQDYQRGAIIGEPTFGKGTVQNVIDINRFAKKPHQDYGQLKTTVAQFYRIRGSSNQHKGVIPDIAFPTMQDLAKHGERTYPNALPWDQIRPVNYVVASAPIHYLPVAKKRHEQRIKTTELFRLFLLELELARRNDKQQISLLAERRQREWERFLKSKKEIKNKMRIVQGLRPLAIDPDAEDVAEEDVEPVDVLLNEAANILNDLIVMPEAGLLTRLK